MRREFQLTSLEEDFKALGLVDQIDAVTSDGGEEADGELDERKMTAAQKKKRSRTAAKGKEGFVQIMKGGKRVGFKRVTTKMKMKRKKYTRSAAGKRAAKRSRRWNESNDYGRDSLMSQLSELAGLIEGIDHEANKFEDYVECLENAIELINLLGENFSGVEGMEEIIERLEVLGEMAGNGHDQLVEMDELTEEITEDLDKGIEMMVEELREAMDLWNEVKENLEEEEPETEEEGEEIDENEDAEDEYPSFFTGTDG